MLHLFLNGPPFQLPFTDDVSRFVFYYHSTGFFHRYLYLSGPVYVSIFCFILYFLDHQEMYLPQPLPPQF